MPTESTTFSSYSSHNNLVSLYESIFKGDIAPLNFNLRITGYLEHPSLNLSKVLSNLLSNRLTTDKNKKTLDNE